MNEALIKKIVQEDGLNTQEEAVLKLMIIQLEAQQNEQQ